MSDSLIPIDALEGVMTKVFVDGTLAAGGTARAGQGYGRKVQLVDHDAVESHEPRGVEPLERECA